MTTTKILTALLFLLPLTGCIAAIGNTGTEARAATPALRAIAREKLEVATRIVMLCERHRDELRLQHDAGRVDARAVIEAEIRLEGRGCACWTCAPRPPRPATASRPEPAPGRRAARPDQNCQTNVSDSSASKSSRAIGLSAICEL